MIPLETKLTILQQSEYEWPRYQEWVKENKHYTAVLHPKKWTLKLRLLRAMAVILPLSTALTLLQFPQWLITRALLFRATLKLRQLQRNGLLVVAIAGSYGKTSTKYITHHLIQTSKRTLMTPENINTPIGISRLILTQLNSSHEVFIAELGEYYPGDIAALVRFLNPNFKILTPVGYAHLERFGSEVKLTAGLRELLTTQPTVGKSFVFGEQYDYSKIDEVQVSRAGTEFSYNSVPYFIPLFGKHNAVNALPGIWLAKQLGIDDAVIQAQLASVPYIPHRLEPTQLEQNILLLDNGYNSNPASAREALAVLKTLEGTQRVVSTPGFIELGETQVQENELLGEEIASVADLCIVIRGVNTQALQSGLKRGGMQDDQIIIADGEEEGMKLLQGKLKPSAIILFENSVPELYKKN